MAVGSADDITQAFVAVVKAIVISDVSNASISNAATFIFDSDGESTLFDMAINDNRCVSIIGDNASLVLDI